MPTDKLHHAGINNSSRELTLLSSHEQTALLRATLIGGGMPSGVESKSKTKITSGFNYIASFSSDL